jgi:hypothetical protein
VRVCSSIEGKISKRQNNTAKRLNVISQLEKGELIVTHALMLDQLIVVYVQFVMMLIELKKVLSEELK